MPKEEISVEEFASLIVAMQAVREASYWVRDDDTGFDFGYSLTWTEAAGKACERKGVSAQWVQALVCVVQPYCETVSETAHEWAHLIYEGEKNDTLVEQQ